MVKRYFKLERKNIAVVQFIIEGYGEMATVTTLDSLKAVIRISIIPDFAADMDGLINYLKNKYNFYELSGYENDR